MIPDKAHQAVSDANERIAEECFKRTGLKPIRLDVRGRRQTTKRPDLLVNDASDRSVVVCEVKTILSAGYSKDRGALVSTMDPKLYEQSATDTEAMPATAFVYDIDLRDMETGTSNAVVKYRTLLKDRHDLEGVPLVVVFFFDFYADHFDLYDRRELERFPDVAGILRIVSQEPNTKQFKLVENKWAKVKLPRDLVDWCIT